MKKIIRLNVFETNSSSSHSIVIDRASRLYKSITPNNDGNIVLEGGEFGWEIKSYRDPLTKANYCAIDAAQDKNKLQMLEKVICEHTGAKKVILNFSDDWKKGNYAYIDHQSRGTSFEAFENEQTLKDFIFGRDSVLYTDNDNH